MDDIMGAIAEIGDDVVQVVFHPGMIPYFVTWLSRFGFSLVELPHEPDELRTFMVDMKLFKPKADL